MGGVDRNDQTCRYSKSAKQYRWYMRLVLKGLLWCVFNAYLIEGRERERNVLFNDALNTFYQRLYGVRHMVKDHSDSEKGNPLSPHRLLIN